MEAAIERMVAFLDTLDALDKDLEDEEEDCDTSDLRRPSPLLSLACKPASP